MENPRDYNLQLKSEQMLVDLVLHVKTWHDINWQGDTKSCREGNWQGPKHKNI